MWRDETTGSLYIGDCRSGDRAATPEEIADWQAARAAYVPPVVRSGQLILALAELDKLEVVKAAVAQVGGLQADLWAHASEFDRADSMVDQLGTAAGMTAEDIDAVFRLAATK